MTGCIVRSVAANLYWTRIKRVSILYFIMSSHERGRLAMIGAPEISLAPCPRIPEFGNLGW